MKSYGKKAAERELDRLIKEKTREELLHYVTHYDLCMLITLHRDFGFGAARLEKYYRQYVERFTEYQARYYDEDDLATFGSRSDEYQMNEELLAIGFDYEALVAEYKKE